MIRLRAVIVKEIWDVLRDPKARIVLVIPPLLQLFIITFATTLDVTNVSIGFLDQSGGRYANEVVQRVSGSPNFRKVMAFHSVDELARAIDDQKVIAAIVIEQDFDRKLAAGKPAQIGAILDGRRSNAARIVSAYLGQIAGGIGAELRPRLQASTSEVTNWFNPALDYIWFTLPSLIAIIVMVAGLAITSQTVSREREMGTFDQLMVSPLRVHEILLGKMVPPFLIGLVNATIYLVLAPLVFGVPMLGSLALFYLSLVFYLLALIGVGLLVSSASQSQQQAFLGSFFVMTPLMLLSGFSSPIDNMPEWLQVVTYANPTRYFLIIVQGLFLKAMPAWAVFEQLWPMVLIALATLGAPAWLFRARME